MEAWKLRQRVLVFADPPWVEVYTDTVELPDGRVRERYHRIVLPDYAVIVAVTPERRFVMIREYKHGTGSVTLSAPAGGLAPGEPPLDCARRELREETGYAADDWRALGSFVTDGTTGCGRAHLFLARDARRVTAPDLDETEEIDVVLLDEAELRAALGAGELALMPSACAVGLALLALAS